MTDDNDSLESKILKKVYLWLVAGGLAIGGIGGSGVLRVDKFGRTDFHDEIEAHEQRMLQMIDYRIDHAEWSIRKDMPPELTKQRIKQLERAMEKLDPTYQPPSQGWQ